MFEKKEEYTLKLSFQSAVALSKENQEDLLTLLQGIITDTRLKTLHMTQENNEIVVKVKASAKQIERTKKHFTLIANTLNGKADAFDVSAADRKNIGIINMIGKRYSRSKLGVNSVESSIDHQGNTISMRLDLA